MGLKLDMLSQYVLSSFSMQPILTYTQYNFLLNVNNFVWCIFLYYTL